ncbi:ABC transporter substrate-binding protein [Devosia sp.]|uniref:ABC transporter substrate-binding protein n=1 Tax=Devosia sp. TaxID=1871048 RepID=UPI001AD2DC4D|nr:ABC transporter substrate-binding protein [Devosia sp.]MBN9335118.1 ABC transporter substrate-binding protein [Devosia sp.]
MFRAFWAAPLLVAFAVAPALAAPVFDERGCATAYEPGTDYFGTKSEVEYAANFSVAYFDHYKVVTVAQPYPGGARESYVLVQCGTPEPELGPDLAGAQHITVPVHSLFSGGTSQSPALVALGEVGAVTGVAQRDLIATPELIEHMQDQPVVEYAGSGVVNIEAVVAAAPDVLIAGGNGEAEMARIAAAGVPVVNYADWQETSPLGRAEWLKFMGLFFNAETRANAVFSDIVGRYDAAKALVSDVPESERPLVLSGQSFGGVFFAAGGRSFIARLIEDAGGRYVFDDDTGTGAFQIHDLERLIVRARAAKVWIQASINYHTLADIGQDDPRLAALPAAQAGQVWVPDALKGPNGGVQFYELGNARPDLVLMDLISILHPDRVGDYPRVFNRSIVLD